MANANTIELVPEDGAPVGERLGAATHSTPAESAARGKAARAELPRSAHGGWEPAPRRRDPVDLLEDQAATRLPELGPIRYGRMLVSPFTFFRGAAFLMAADLADGPRTGLYAQLCGDAHLSNFGIFAAPDRKLVFSLNDFDETLPGPFEWDVKRLAASLAVAGRDRGFDRATRGAVVKATVREYRDAMARFASMRNIDVWHARLDVASIRDQLARFRQADEAAPVHGGRRAYERQHESAHQAVSYGRRGAPYRRRPAPRHPDRGRHAGRGGRHTSRTSYGA